MTLKRRSLFTLALAVPDAAALAPRAKAASPEVYNEDGIAVDGSDVVAYFTEGKPVVGDAAITHDYLGVTWRFSSAENRNTAVTVPLLSAGAALPPPYPRHGVSLMTSCI